MVRIVLNARILVRGKRSRLLWWGDMVMRQTPHSGGFKMDWGLTGQDMPKFKQIRHDAGLSLAQLSDIIKVHTRTIRRYEDGGVPISGPVSVLMGLIKNGKL